VCGQKRLVRREVLVFGGGQERIESVGVGEGFGMSGEDVERMRVDLSGVSEGLGGERERKQTFAIRARKKLRTRNLKRSSSVCITMSLKFVFGSMFPV
jgi:hypothetical protein